MRKKRKDERRGRGGVWPNLYNNTQRAAKEKLQTTLTHKHKENITKNTIKKENCKQTLLYIAGQSQFVVLL